jgi:hypothetical protein
MLRMIGVLILGGWHELQHGAQVIADELRAAFAAIALLVS